MAQYLAGSGHWDTRLCEAGFSETQTTSYTGHSPKTVHAVYQKFRPTAAAKLGDAEFFRHILGVPQLVEVLFDLDSGRGFGQLRTG
jgi:hypothetical protein